MAEEFITNVSTNKKGEKKEIKYRVDADFVPTEIKEICIEFIENYCVANGKTEWLAETLDKKTTHKHQKGDKEGQVITDKNGKPKLFSYSFPEIRADFAKEFFGDIIKGETPKDSKLANLRARLKK